MEEIIAVTQKLVNEHLVGFYVAKVVSIGHSATPQHHDYTFRNCLHYLMLLANRVASDDETEMYQYSENN